MQSKTPSLIGAGIGLALFLAVALLPAMLYGGYAGVLLAGGIFGTPVEPTFLVRALIVFGIIMGVAGVGSLFAVMGAVAGAAVGALTSLASRKPATQEVASKWRRRAARHPPRARVFRPGSRRCLGGARAHAQRFPDEPIARNLCDLPAIDSPQTLISRPLAP